MNSPQVIIFHSPLQQNPSADEADVLDEVLFFEQGLVNLGYSPVVIPFPYNLLQLGELLDEYRPSFVVNLVETLFSDGKLVHLAPYLFDHFKVPYTGCPSGALVSTSDKLMAKKIMKASGINTPLCFTFRELKNESMLNPDSLFLIKSIWEHASFGIDERQKLLFNGPYELLMQMQRMENADDYFAEEYIDGREFNISIVELNGQAVVLPAAEIRFNYPSGKPRIVGYRAKWDESSFEYKNTNRSFDFDEEDKPLIKNLEEICKKCWNIFNLRGYARVDFRVDNNGKAFVLEINANPCISADSGFVAAALHAGITQTELINALVKIFLDFQLNPMKK